MGFTNAPSTIHGEKGWLSGFQQLGHHFELSLTRKYSHEKIIYGAIDIFQHDCAIYSSIYGAICHFLGDSAIYRQVYSSLCHERGAVLSQGPTIL